MQLEEIRINQEMQEAFEFSTDTLEVGACDDEKLAMSVRDHRASYAWGLDEVRHDGTMLVMAAIRQQNRHARWEAKAR